MLMIGPPGTGKSMLAKRLPSILPVMSLDEALLELCGERRVEFNWIKGHADHPQNKRCDALAVTASNGKDLPADEAFENPKGALPKDDLFSL